MNKKLSQKDLLGKVEKNIKKNGLIKPKDVVIVAVSGGVDSVCLLDILDKLSKKLHFDLSVCHYNHKLRGIESDKDELFVSKLARERGRDFEVARRKREPCNSEDEARELRYKFFKKILESSRGAKIAIAHNSSDLTETLLQRVVRGTGIRGLKSIPFQRKNFIRPLLPHTRSEILEYLNKEKIKFRIDKSNFDPSFLRNYLRKYIVPKLIRKNPKFEEGVYALSKSMERDYQFIENETKKVFEKVATITYKKVTISKDDFSKLHSSIKFHLLLMVLEELGVKKDVTSKHLEDVISMISKNVGNKSLPLPHSLRVKLFGGKIIITRG